MQLATDPGFRSVHRSGSSASPGPATTADTRHRVGPNTLIQTLAALRGRRGAGWAIYVHGRAALPDPLPRRMVDERLFARLVAVLVDELGAEEAEAILAAGGSGTGSYVLTHRIPRLVRTVLPRLPRTVALRLLLRAIERHAWTFAGSGRFEARAVKGGAEIELAPSLVCATAATGARPMGAYYARAVEVLVRGLVEPRARVVEEACVAMGHPSCRFRVTLIPPSPRRGEPSRETPCASS